MIKIEEDFFDWNKSNNIPDSYLDNPNKERLTEYKLPVIDNVATLFKALNLSVADAKKFFYPYCRRTFLYRSYQMPKKLGGSREISIPIPELALVQKAINNVILNKFQMSSYCTGFKKNMSLIDNAKPHLNCKTLLKFDVKDFFGSIRYNKVYKQFKFYGYGNKVARLLTLLCVDADDKLPQGAATSPTLSNLVCLRLDKRIGLLCKKLGYNYTRYADDITISSNTKLGKYEINYIKDTINLIVEEEGFKLNEKKTHVFKEGQQLVVTGIHINNGVMKPSKSIINEIENAFYFISKFGLEDHLKHIKCEKSNYLGHIYGLISYVYMINPQKGLEYYDKLSTIVAGEL